MTSIFADRLWWARHRAHLGATKLARLVGCAQSLISSLERNNAEKSKLNDRFAKALKVDPTWLAFGTEGRAPEGFDEDAARRGRMKGERTNVVSLETVPGRFGEPVREPRDTLVDEAQMRSALVDRFMAYARCVGAERAEKALEMFRHAVSIVAIERADKSPDP